MPGSVHMHWFPSFWCEDHWLKHNGSYKFETMLYMIPTTTSSEISNWRCILSYATLTTVLATAGETMAFQSLALSDLTLQFIMNQILSASTEDTDSISISALNLSSRVPHCIQHQDCTKHVTEFINRTISMLSQETNFFFSSVSLQD